MAPAAESSNGTNSKASCLTPNSVGIGIYLMLHPQPSNGKKQNRLRKKSRQNNPESNPESNSRWSPIARALYFSVSILLIVHSLSYCPTDTYLESPICHSLFHYRRLVLEPYVLPQFRKVLAHPFVAPRVAVAMPYAMKAQNVVKPALVRGQHAWNHRVVSRWDKYVVPPIQRIKRRLEPWIAPAYKRLISRPSNSFRINLYRLEYATRPYRALAAAKSRNVYSYWKPYWMPLWHRLKYRSLFLHRLVQHQRARFVDPHVARIWAKVVELSSARPATTHHAPIREEDVESLLEATVAETSWEEPVEETVHSESFDHSQSGLEDLGDTPNVETLVSASSIISASASDVDSAAASVTASVIEEISASIASVPASAIADPLLADPRPDDDEGLEDLIGALETDDPVDSDDPPVETDPAPPSEEEQAQAERSRLARVAEKRAEIEGRHTNWEQSMEALELKLKAEYITSLEALRAAAVQELHESNKVQSEIEKFASESNMYLKACETYLTRLENGGEENKLGLWVKFVDRLDKKFRDRMEALQKFMQDWHDGVTTAEMAAAQDAIDAVQRIGDSAQEDLAMDYSWLDDVTVDDWTRYHNLMRRVENFTETMHMLQNGLHGESPALSVLHALERLWVDVHDVITGFFTRVNTLRRSGERAFGDSESQSTQSVAGEHGDVHKEVPPVLLGRDKEEVVDAFARAGEGEGAAQSEEASDTK